MQESRRQNIKKIERICSKPYTVQVLGDLEIEKLRYRRASIYMALVEPGTLGRPKYIEVESSDLEKTI